MAEGNLFGEPTPVPDDSHRATNCKCDNCNWRGKPEDCETEWEQECWEMPRYQVHICPVCGEPIDNYW